MDKPATTNPSYNASMPDPATAAAPNGVAFIALAVPTQSWANISMAVFKWPCLEYDLGVDTICRTFVVAAIAKAPDSYTSE